MNNSNTVEQLSTQNAQEISIAELHNAWQHLSQGEVIVDIRSPDDYSKAHVPGSMNIPFATVADRCDELRAYNRIYFHCYGGQGSKAIAEKLSGIGFENLCFVGQAGFADWQAAGYPVN
jgi:rhodanese-related sulfurtransferase